MGIPLFPLYHVTPLYTGITMVLLLCSIILKSYHTIYTSTFKVYRSGTPW
jgi:hypothetical protein